MENQILSTSNSKVFFRFLAILITLLVCAGVIFSYIFEKKIILSGEISGAAKVNRIIHSEIKNEIPIFGSSRAQGCYVPSILGENYYNYGIDGISAFVWLFFLEKELSKDKEGDIIINFDLGGFAYSNGDIANYIPSYPATKNLMRSDFKPHYGIPFIKYFGHFELYTKYYLNERMNLTKHTDKGGSFELNFLTDEAFNELVALRKRTQSSFANYSELISRFKSLVESTNRRIFLVIAPYHSSFFHNFENLPEADEFLNQVNRKSNIEVIDFRNDIAEDTLYINTLHLNYAGAKIFSKKLRETMAQR